eukprot:114934_1
MTTQSAASIKMEGLNDLLSKMNQHSTGDNPTLNLFDTKMNNNTNLASSIQNVQILSMPPVPPIPLLPSSSLPTLSTAPRSAIANTNNSEPMVSVQLSVLNELVSKIKIYESFFQQLFAPNIQSLNLLNNTSSLLNNRSLNPFNYTQVPKVEDPILACANYATPLNQYCAPKTETQTDHKQTIQQVKKELKLSSDSNSDSVSVSSGNQIQLQPKKERSKASAAAMSTRSYNKKIGHKYSEKKLKEKRAKNGKVRHEKIGQYFVCKECGKRYQYLCNLRSHAKVHTDNAYICEFCHKKFGRKANYQEHRRIHTGELPYKCKVCGKKFRQRHAWKDHQRVHDKNKLDLPPLSSI